MTVKIAHYDETTVSVALSKRKGKVQMTIYSDHDLKITKRADYEKVNHVCNALYDAFHPNGPEEGKEMDERFHAHWILFLNTVGWTEDEYWDERERRTEEDLCQDCGEPLEDHDEEDLNSDPLGLPDPVSKKDDGGDKGLN